MSVSINIFQVNLGYPDTLGFPPHGPDVLPATQPTVSKHWRLTKHSL